MTILEVTAVWSGLQGLPGYTSLHYTNDGIITSAVDNAVAATHALMTDLAVLVTSGCHIQVQSEVKEFDAATGALVGVHTPGDPAADIVCGAGAGGPAPAGLCIAWGTGGINRGRRVRGRTFIVPLGAAYYQSDGTLTPTAVSAANAAAEEWRTSAAYETLVWSRPRGGSGGAAFPITSSNVRDQAAVLRSRRG